MLKALTGGSPGVAQVTQCLGTPLIGILRVLARAYITQDHVVQNAYLITYVGLSGKSHSSVPSCNRPQPSFR